MLKKITKLLLVTTIIGGVVGYANLSKSSTAGAPASVCGEPKTNTCGKGTGCHNPANVVLNSNNVQIRITRDFGKTPTWCTTYCADSSYIFNVWLRRSSKINGFEQVLIDHNANGQGTTNWLSGSSNALAVQFVPGGSSKTYATQCGGSCVSTSDGSKLSTWQYIWKAPTSTAGTLVIYTCALKGGGKTAYDDSTFCRVDSFQYCTGGVGITEIGLNKNITAFTYGNKLHIGYILNNATTVSFDIYDIYGNKIYAINRKVSTTDNYDINVLGWPKGIYVIRGTVGSETWAKKIVIQ